LKSRLQVKNCLQLFKQFLNQKGAVQVVKEVILRKIDPEQGLHFADSIRNGVFMDEKLLRGCNHVFVVVQVHPKRVVVIGVVLLVILHDVHQDGIAQKVIQGIGVFIGAKFDLLSLSWFIR
jgi:hypothetical protein